MQFKFEGGVGVLTGSYLAGHVPDVCGLFNQLHHHMYHVCILVSPCHRPRECARVQDGAYFVIGSYFDHLCH